MSPTPLFWPGNAVEHHIHALRMRAENPLAGYEPVAPGRAAEHGFQALRMRAENPLAGYQHLVGHPAAPAVQAKPQAGAPAPSASPASVQQHLGEGDAMAPEVTARFSRAYGHDLSDVRLHRESPAATALGARAVTVGRDVAFAPGEYKPGTPAGDKLIGHELAHVVQQAGGAGAVQGAGLSRDRYEAEADRAADRALAGEPVSPITRVAAAVVQRSDAPRVSLTPAAAEKLSDPELAEMLESVRKQLSTPGLPALEEQGARENLVVLEAEQARRNAALFGLSALKGPLVPRPAGLPMGQGFMLQPIDLPESVASSIEEGKLVTVPTESIMMAAGFGGVPDLKDAKTRAWIESLGSAYAGARMPLNAALQRVGFAAAGDYAVGIVGVPRVQLNPFARNFHFFDPAAPLDYWGHTAMYIRQGGRITIVRGFNPIMTQVTPGNFGAIEAGAVGVPAEITPDSYLFKSTNARSIEYPLTEEAARALASKTPPVGKPGVGQPSEYTANPANYVAKNPAKGPPGSTASNCGMWAICQVEAATGKPVGRPGQGTITSVGENGAVTPGRASQGRIIALADEIAAAGSGEAGVVASRMPAVLRVMKIGGRVFLVAGVALGAYEIATAKEGERGRTALGVLGGFAGGFALGATAGLICGPGAPVCSIITGLVLGTVGAIGGRAATESIFDAFNPSKWADDNPAHVQQALEQLASAKPVCPNCHAPAGEGDKGASAPGALGPPKSRVLTKDDQETILQWLQRTKTGD